MTGGGDDFASPYQATYDWSASSSASGAQSVVAHDNAGLTASSSFTVTPDTTAPSGQAIDNDGGPYYTTLAVPLTISDGSDSGSGLDASSGVVERQSATLASDSCAAWSGWSPVTLVGGADTSVLSGECYRYRYEISDNVGNQSSPSASSGTAKIDTSAPSSPTVSFSALTNAVAGGQTVYFRPGVAGGFTVTADSTDAQSGIELLRLPGARLGLERRASRAQRSTTRFGSSAADPVEPNDVTAQNNAGLTSSPALVHGHARRHRPGQLDRLRRRRLLGRLVHELGLGQPLGKRWRPRASRRSATRPTAPTRARSTARSTRRRSASRRTTTVKFRAYDRVGNEETVGSQLVRIDTSAAGGACADAEREPGEPEAARLGNDALLQPAGRQRRQLHGRRDDERPAVRDRPGHLPGARRDDRRRRRLLEPVPGQLLVDEREQRLRLADRHRPQQRRPHRAPPASRPRLTRLLRAGGSVDYANGYAGGSVTVTTDDGNDAPLRRRRCDRRHRARLDEPRRRRLRPVHRRWSDGHLARLDDRLRPLLPLPLPRLGQRRQQRRLHLGERRQGLDERTERAEPDARRGAGRARTSTSPARPSSTTRAARNSGTFTVAADVADSGGSGIDRVSFPSLGGHDRRRRRHDEPVPGELRLGLGQQRVGRRRRSPSTTTPA